MTRTLTIIALLFATPILAACEDINSQRINDERDCEETAIAIGDLLEQADGEWKKLVLIPETAAESEEIKAEIKWLTDVAANYSIVFETFCK